MSSVNTDGTSLRNEDLAQDPASSCNTLPVPIATQRSKEELKSVDVEVDVPRDFFVFPVPKYLRHNPDKPAHFGLFLNIIFAIATTFSEWLLRYWTRTQLTLTL